MKRDDRPLINRLRMRGILPNRSGMQRYGRGHYPARILMPEECLRPDGLDEALDEIASRT